MKKEIEGKKRRKEKRRKEEKKKKKLNDTRAPLAALLWILEFRS